MSYDTAITVFGKIGNLFQVEYAMAAVNQGLCSIGIRGTDCIVMGVEKNSTTILQETRTIRKVQRLDDATCICYSGLTPDARILTNIAKVECQSYSLNYDDRVPINYIARYIASVQQKYTQKSGARPFGISTLVGGFDSKGQPRLFQTDPSGACTEWKAVALGKHRKTVMENLEKNYQEEYLPEEKCLELACRVLLEVVQSGGKNIELVVLKQKVEGDKKVYEYNMVSEEKIKTLIEAVDVKK
ncbi:hypothetical protein ABPG72_017905 [Tetrahymena utriculariae]